MKRPPVWAFHGAKDANVLPSKSSSMMEAVRKEGGKVRFTLYSDNRVLFSVQPPFMDVCRSPEYPCS